MVYYFGDTVTTGLFGTAAEPFCSVAAAGLPSQAKEN